MKKKTILILGLITTLLFSGCGASSSTYENLVGTKGAGGFNAGYDYVAPEESGNYEEIVEDTKPENKTDKKQIKNGEKLVYTCDLTIQTLEFNETIKAINEKIKEYEGIVEQQTQSDDSYDWYYSNYVKRSGTLHSYIKVRIPTEKYEEFLSAIEGNGKVINKSQNVENISKTYYETEAVMNLPNQFAKQKGWGFSFCFTNTLINN